MASNARLIPVIAALAAASLATHAQDLRNEQPQMPAPMQPSQPVLPAQPPASPSPGVADEALTPLAAVRVQGVVLLADPQQVRPAGWPLAELGPQRIDTRLMGLPAGDNAVEAGLRQVLGAPVTPDTLREIPRLIQAEFGRAGRPFVNVTVPPQDFTTGVLQLVVVQGVLGEVTVEGNQHFPTQVYRDAIRAQPGSLIDAAQLDADLRWIGENPFRSATVTAAPGRLRGQTDLVVLAQDRKPWRVYAGVDNTGTASTQAERLQLGFNHGDLFGLGHQFGLQRSASPDQRSSVAWSGSYVVPLPWRHTLSVAASQGTVRPSLPAPFDQTGRSEQVSVNYRMPLPDVAAVRHTVSGAFEAKGADNNLLFSDIPVTNAPTRIYQWVLGWEGRRPDALGEFSWDASLTWSPGGWGWRNQDAAFNVSRAGASARYSRTALRLSRSTRLPAGFVLNHQLSAQGSNANLLGSEQLAASGTYAVRGFRENRVNADQGWVLRNDLLAPSLPGLSALVDALPPDSIRPFVFVDMARVGPHRALFGESTRIALASAGLGLHWQLGAVASLRVEVGKPVHFSEAGRPETRGHVGLNLQY